VGSGIVEIVATLLPWASRENRATELTTEYGAGAVGFVLVALALVAILCALSGASARSATLQNLAWAFAAGCVVTAVTLALTRIKAANDAAMSSVGVGNRTSYEAGAVLGVLGSAALLVGCLVLRSYSQRGAHDPAMTEPQVSS
jgi:hypothetical protein